MKVPSGKTGTDGPPKYAKDRTLTRRTVKGAAGGMKGVDYEDDRRPDPAVVAAKRADARAQRPEGATRPPPLSENPALKDTAHSRASGAPKEEAEMVLDDEDALTRDAKARQRAKHFVPRDRFTVDKDAPDRQRQVRWDLLDEEEEEEEATWSSEEAEVDLAAIAEAIASADDEEQSRAHLFVKNKTPAPGDPRLTDPGEAMRSFGAPLAYAQHALLLSEAFRQACGATRAETVAYLAELFVGVPDLGFARSALRELGSGTGIVEIYPLEVIVEILDRFPTFLPRVRFGEVFETVATPVAMRPFRALELLLPVDLKVRGFAVIGGARPGYRFEPGIETGHYRLVMGAAGDFELLVSARSPAGGTVVQRFRVEVEGTPEALPESPPRDADAIARWPRPSVRAPETEAREEPSSEESSALSAGERWSRTEQDALRGPKGEEEWFDFRGVVVDEGPRTSEKAVAEEAGLRARAGLAPTPATDEDPLTRLTPAPRLARRAPAPPRAPTSAVSPRRPAPSPGPRPTDRLPPGRPSKPVGGPPLPLPEGRTPASAPPAPAASAAERPSPRPPGGRSLETPPQDGLPTPENESPAIRPDVREPESVSSSEIAENVPPLSSEGVAPEAPALPSNELDGPADDAALEVPQTDEVSAAEEDQPGAPDTWASGEPEDTPAPDEAPSPTAAATPDTSEDQAAPEIGPDAADTLASVDAHPPDPEGPDLGEPEAATLASVDIAEPEADVIRALSETEDPTQVSLGIEREGTEIVRDLGDPDGTTWEAPVSRDEGGVVRDFDAPEGTVWQAPAHEDLVPEATAARGQDPSLTGFEPAVAPPPRRAQPDLSSATPRRRAPLVGAELERLAEDLLIDPDEEPK